MYVKLFVVFEQRRPFQRVDCFFVKCKQKLPRMLSHSASRGSIESLRGFAAWFQDGLAFLSYSYQPLHAKIYALTRQSTLLEFRQFGNHQACN